MAKAKRSAKKSASARRQRSAEKGTNAAAEEVSFDTWVRRVRKLHRESRPVTRGSRPPTRTAFRGAAAAPPVGACQLKNPNGGGKLCVQTTPAACKAMGGKFKGGACGG